MWESFKATTPYPLFIFFDFVVTFMLFPSLTLAKKTSLGTVWTSIIMLMMYNIGDFAGKLIGDFRGSFNARSIAYMFGCRLFFFYTIPLMDKQFTQEDYLLNNNIFPFFNQVMFAFTNGLVISNFLFIQTDLLSCPLRKLPTSIKSMPVFWEEFSCNSASWLAHFQPFPSKRQLILIYDLNYFKFESLRSQLYSIKK